MLPLPTKPCHETMLLQKLVLDASFMENFRRTLTQEGTLLTAGSC
jgi:hypothetical protein